MFKQGNFSKSGFLKVKLDVQLGNLKNIQVSQPATDKTVVHCRFFFLVAVHCSFLFNSSYIEGNLWQEMVKEVFLGHLKIF